MKLDHSFTVPVGVEQAWQVLLDIERIAPCMPGAAIESVDGDDFTGKVKVKLGPINLTYRGKASFVEKDEAAHRAVIDARGKDTRGNGTAAAKITANLKADGDATKVDVRTELDITGKPAQFGRGVMVDVGNKLLGQFADCLAAKLAAGEPAPAEAGPAEPPAEAARSEPAPAEPAPAEPAIAEPASNGARSARHSATDGDEVPAPAAPTAPAPTAPAPTAPAAPAPVMAAPVAALPAAPPPEPEPINLITSAGPAIAKRLAPLLGALALVALIVALSRRRRARR